MPSRKHLIPVLLTASIALGTAAIADDSDSDSENAGPVTWSCQGESESVDPSKPDYGEKLSGLFRADIFPDGHCEVVGAASFGGPNGAGTATAPALSCSWERTDELGPFSGRLRIDWRGGESDDYNYIRVTEDVLFVGRSDNAGGEVGNITCLRQTYRGTTSDRSD